MPHPGTFVLRRGYLSEASRLKNKVKSAFTSGIVFASARGMSRASISSTYDEPTVMWRMRRGRHFTAHAMIGLQGTGAWVMWFVNDWPLGIRDFDNCESAIRWSDRLKAQNWSVGWRLVTDGDEGTPSRS
jgi:hypothetical protein